MLYYYYYYYYYIYIYIYTLLIIYSIIYLFIVFFIICVDAAGGSLNSYGHMRLRHLLSKEAIPDDVERQSSLGCQFSSVGSLSANWVIEEFGRSLMACAGHHGDVSSPFLFSFLLFFFSNNRSILEFSNYKIIFIYGAFFDIRRKRVKRRKRTWSWYGQLWTTFATRSTATPPEVRLLLRPSVPPSAPSDWLIVWGGGLGGWWAGSLCFGSSNRRDFMTPLFRQYKAMQEGRGRVTPHIKCFVRHRDSHLAW